MIYFSADDYGLCNSMSARIQECVEKGALDKVSVFPNFNCLNTDTLREMAENNGIQLSLHLNLVEGKCMSDKKRIHLIADENGNFNHTFIGLLKQNLIHAKEFEEQAYREIRAQILYWKSILPEGMPFYIDSHQHTHMIPAVFCALIKVLKDEGITLEYMRIPAEPVLPYIMTPSLYFTYRPVNIIKQCLLNFLWIINKRHAESRNIHTSYFLGILFSGKMDAGRVAKILPRYKKISDKYERDIEVLFHPGYMDENELDENTVFNKFYLSPNRKTEFNSLIKISERSVEK